MKKQQRTAIEAVARRFSATWKQGSGPAEAHIAVAGKRVAVDITTLKRRGPSRGDVAKARLRFDKVATRLIERLQAALGGTVPDGVTVLLTITAPIRVASRTAASLEGRIHTLLERRPTRRDQKATIQGNRVRIRVIRDAPERAPKLIGFVHNPESDALLLLNMAGDLLELVSAKAGRRAPRFAGDRWLVVMNARSRSCWEAYCYIYSQLGLATPFKKVLMVFADEHVEVLTG